jgi:hypothetical protein
VAAGAAEQAHEDAREHFQTALRDARAAGASFQTLGDVCGLSRQRIAQLVK